MRQSIQSRRVFIGVLAYTGLALSLAPQAAGQFTNVQRTLFRGLEYAGDPLFLSRPQGGPLFDFNRFSQRVEFNRAGRGYTYESFRLFGPDSFNNTNTLDLGPLKIQLLHDPTVVPSNQPVGIHNRVGFTTRFIPEVFFESQTGQRTFNQFTGIGTFSPTPVSYTVTFNGGLQDFEWTGNVLVDAAGRINAMGFYDFRMQITNVGGYEANGVFVHDEQVTDFDTGPIDVSGNILLDLLAGLAQANGTTMDAVTPRIASGAAQKDKLAEELMGQLESGHRISNEEMQFLVQQMFTSAFLADPLGVMTNGLPSEVPGFEALALSISETGGENEDNRFDGLAVPEPGTIGFLIAAFAILSELRPSRRRWT